MKKFAREGSVGTSIEATIEFGSGNISRATIDGAAVSDGEVPLRVLMTRNCRFSRSFPGAGCAQDVSREHSRR